jgi:hypothetical protein
MLHQDGRVLLLFSGGVDSTFALLKLLETCPPDRILCVYIRLLNPSISKREEVGARALAGRLGCTLEVIDFPKPLRKLHRQGCALPDFGKESVVKNLYGLLLSCERFRARAVVVTRGPGPSGSPDVFSRTPDNYFSDSYAAYRSLGLPCVPLDGPKAAKIELLADRCLLRYVTSCYCAPRFFRAQQRRSKCRLKNLCGVCFKCRELNFHLEKIGRLPLVTS